MNRIRNAVIIIVLCIIGSATYKAGHKSDLGLGTRPDDIHDALAGGPSKHHNKLSLNTPSDDNLKDSLAEGPAIPTGLHNGPHGNTEDNTPPPPRGGDHSGFGNLGGQNPGAQLPPPSNPPSDVSPSGPQLPQ